MAEAGFRSVRTGELVVRLLIIVAGLLLWVAGSNIHDYSFWGIDVGEIVSHLAFLVTVVVALHWIFEARIRNDLVNEIVRIAVGSQRLAESGIVDYIANARRIDYNGELRDSRDVVVCVHYSPRFLEDNYHTLAERKGSNQSLTVITLREESDSATYLLNKRKEADHIRPNMRKIRTLVEQLREAGVKVDVIEHDSILRYSFVLFDSSVWVKFYKNALGMAEVPAIRVRSDTNLFAFFVSDIKALIKQAEEAGRQLTSETTAT